MRLLIIGRLNGELVAASKIAMSRGAGVTQADGVEQGLSVLRAKGADLIMIDVALSVRDLVAALVAERIRTPVVACGTGTDARAAVAAIQAGAKEYIPLPPDPDLIAAVIEAVAADNRSFVWRAASANSGRRRGAPCSSRKSRRWTCACRPSCCAPFRSGSSTVSAARSRCGSISASSPP